MMEYGQFCPIAKATEILGEKWTILIVRELLMGGNRFSTLQRGLSLISPTMLSKRLDTLEANGHAPMMTELAMVIHNTLHQLNKETLS